MKTKIKYQIFGVAAALVGALGMNVSVMAWGPERPTYLNKEPADHVTFNSITDNPVLGDERDFVRIVEKKSKDEPKDAYTNNLELEAGKDYEVFIYYHNNASATFNTKEHDYKGVAVNARVASNFPDALAKGETGQVSAIIRANNAEPAEVWDEANITAKEDMTLHFVSGSAKLQNNWEADDSTMPPAALFAEEGALLGVNELNGVLLGCYEYSGFIVYTIRTVAAGEVEPGEELPEEPIVKPETPVTPSTPSTLPKTGPIEIILAIVVVVAIVLGIVYWRKTSKAVKKVTKNAKGKKR